MARHRAGAEGRPRALGAPSLGAAGGRRRRGTGVRTRFPAGRVPFAFVKSSTAPGLSASSFCATSMSDSRILRSSVWNCNERKWARPPSARRARPERQARGRTTLPSTQERQGPGCREGRGGGETPRGPEHRAGHRLCGHRTRGDLTRPLPNKPGVRPPVAEEAESPSSAPGRQAGPTG